MSTSARTCAGCRARASTTNRGSGATCLRARLSPAPADANGRLVAHILGDYFSEKYGVLDSPVTFVLENGRVTQVLGENQTLIEELIEYLDAGRERPAGR
jgi:aminopeptidase